ncbi:YchJ family metal-binding protein, partial [Arsukibacterium sp.]|uniref:YchJ family metal-binding protein n=1 Tax=Arsukibacterium sp. TaxID=1977258 RepID=UPI00299D6BDB
DYLVQTDHLTFTLNTQKQQALLKNQITEFANSVHFISLSISNWTENITGQAGFDGTVSFVARYIHGNKLESLAEKSYFIFKERWFYVEGQITAIPGRQIGRNDPCPCGSGKKFKHCSPHSASGITADTN